MVAAFSRPEPQVDALATTATPALPVAASLTHQHILAVINTRIAGLTKDRTSITICDIGCGNGALLSYLASCLAMLWSDHRFTFCGLDVSDSGVQAEGFFDRTIAALDASHPETDWSQRLHLIGSRAPWPFDDGSIDIITPIRCWSTSSAMTISWPKRIGCCPPAASACTCSR